MIPSLPGLPPVASQSQNQVQGGGQSLVRVLLGQVLLGLGGLSLVLFRLRRRG